MKPSRIWLVSAPDTPEDTAPARLAADRLSGEAVRRVFALSSQIACETAEALAAPHGLRVEAASTGNLPESLDGLSPDELRGAARRARQALERIASETGGGTAIAVASRCVVQLVVCDLLGMPPESFSRVGQEPHAANLLIRQDYGWVVESVNDQSRPPEAPKPEV